MIYDIYTESQKYLYSVYVYEEIVIQDFLVTHSLKSSKQITDKNFQKSSEIRLLELTKVYYCLIQRETISV